MGQYFIYRGPILNASYYFYISSTLATDTDFYIEYPLQPLSPTLTYNLYTNSARTMIWGNGSSGSQLVTDPFRVQQIRSVTRNYPIYGLIPASQDVVPGVCSDNVMVTLEY